jgi:cellobionic acid phosphorylase
MPQSNSGALGYFIENGFRYRLTSPTAAPNADAFLWNKRMMIQATCRGYATAQFMQPEPAKYAHGPTLAAKTFMQPEHPYFAHHAGRFFYIKDNVSNELMSAPYEPVRSPWDEFHFEPGLADIRWRLTKNNIEITIVLSLAPNDAAECWQMTVKNTGNDLCDLSVTPYFPVGYASWMNQSADFDPQLNAVVSKCITPYQKLEDYPKQKHFKDWTFLSASIKPDSWSARLQSFEGEGGLHNPDALMANVLDQKPALYECPACIMKFNFKLDAGESKNIEFLFGAAESNQEIEKLTQSLFNKDVVEQTRLEQESTIRNAIQHFNLESPDADFNAVANIWLPRQLFYHGDSQRLTTDPQTRNYLQDAMGMTYLNPEHTRAALLTALSQQHASGQMPDGILLEGATELKFINQIPHTDHGVWVILCIQAYLQETAESELLTLRLPFKDSDQSKTVFEHVCLTLKWLMDDCNEQGLSYIAQGDWCDPMNMVGPKGIGVSAWLTQALAVALKRWADICQQYGYLEESEAYTAAYEQQLTVINEHLWDGQWYIRGITDELRRFGTHEDEEGQIFLNTQSWALLANAASEQQKQQLLNAVKDKLDTPYGAMLCAPAFTHMHEHIGRVTQKFPGSAENGSVYNHACMFWCAGLFEANETDRAFQALYDLWAFEQQNGLTQRGQLPIYAPNYYRGAYYQHPSTAGRSSRLFNTGTVAWAYQLMIEKLAGLTGTRSGLKVKSKLPSHWPTMKITRTFRGASISLQVVRDETQTTDTLLCNGNSVSQFELSDLTPGQHYVLVYTIAGSQS